MFKSIVSFFAKAAPRFIGHMMKPGKGVLHKFKVAGRLLDRSGFGKKFASFTGQTIGEFTKECARDAVKQSATSLMGSAIMGGANKIFSGGGGKQYSFPSKSTGATVTGKKAPGIQTTSAAQYGSIRSFNTTTRALGQEANKQNKLRKQQRKIIDKYRKSVQQKRFSVAEITSLSNLLGKDLRQTKRQLIVGLKSGKYTPDGLRTVQASKKVKQPSRIPQEQQQLAAYTKEALDDVNQQMQENIKAVNENISRSIAEMNKKEEEIAQKMMSNLGNYNTIAYKKLADTVTKTEEVAFKKQQESAYYQTDILADKLDSSHDYNSKQLDVVRSELLSNTQTMYELDKQNRMIDENYRALEERKNKGVTLASLAGLLTQTYQMVHASLKTPDMINENVKNAMNSIAFTAGEEVGKLIQTLKELLMGIRAGLVKMYIPVRNLWPVGNILGGVLNGIDWINDRVFRGLLGADDSVIEDMFGQPGNIAKLNEEAEKKEYGNTIGDNKKASNIVVSTGYAGTLFGGGGKHGIKNKAANMTELFETNWAVDEKKKTVEVMTNSGYSVTLKHDRKENESLDEYKQRKKLEAVDRETNENFTYSGNGAATRDNAQQARDRLNQAMREIEMASVKTSGQQGSGYGLDVTYDVVSYKVQPNCPHSEPPATDRDYGEPNQNCTQILTDSFFREAWGYITPFNSLTLKGGLKMRLLKALREASAKGIKYQITSTFRTPSCYYGYPSPHHLGIAVDIAIEGMPEAIQQCWAKAKEFNPESHGTYWSVILTSEDLDAIINRSEWKEGADETKYDLFVQWGEFQKICSENHLSVGVNRFRIASKARGITDGTKRLDMVHIQVAEQAAEIDVSKQKNKDLMNKGLSEIVGIRQQEKVNKEINKGVGLDYKLRLNEFEKSVLGDIEGVKQKEKGWAKEDLDYFYTDRHGNAEQIYGIGNANIRDFVRDENGKIIERKKDEIEKQIKTDTGMALLDKVRANKLTPTEKAQLKQLIEEWEKMDPEARKKSKREKQMGDMQIVYNISNNITTMNPNQLGNGPEENNMQY